MKTEKRILKYGKLREKITQEIKIMRLKEANYDPQKWVPNFEEITKIDPKIVLNAIEYKNHLFPTLKPFLNAKTRARKLNLEKTRQQLKELGQQIDKLNHRLIKKKQTFNNYVPNLTNEKFLRQKQENLLYELTVLDEKFASSSEKLVFAISKEKKTTKNELINEIVENNYYIDQKIVVLEKIRTRNKAKTLWIFLVSIFLIVAIATALMIYFWWNVR